MDDWVVCTARSHRRSRVIASINCKHLQVPRLGKLLDRKR